ncbi:MAG: SH3 domain-containing protein [Candidatus Gracilibacteria bacterium]|nr:SH3 domain-containing protein [Candidatus Gracilibacteria bacterium]
MGNFENANFNFSTIERVDGTIQDKIDNGKLTIESLTSAKLQHLQADIDDNKGSYLRIRDDNGKVIGKLNEDKNVEFLDKKEVSTKNGKKVFLKIKTNNATGWVSADYMKADTGKKLVLNKRKISDGKGGEVVLNGRTIDLENKSLEKPDFNYKEPQKDSE